MAKIDENAPIGSVSCQVLLKPISDPKCDFRFFALFA